MHDIDSTRLEANTDQNEYSPYGFTGEAEATAEALEVPMSEEEEEALAAELLGVGSEAEMDQFLGKLFRKIAPAVRGAAKFLSKNGGPLSAALKGIARKALPFVGGAIGSAIPIPGVGTAIGTAVGQAAGNLLEAETDHLETDEREFQLAKRFVRLASQAVRQGVRVPMRMNPMSAANLTLRQTIQRLNRGGGFRVRPVYRRCPPCAPCPPCPSPLTDAGPTAANGSADTGDTPEPMAAPADAAPAGEVNEEYQTENDEAEYGYAGEAEAEHDEAEAEAEAENYEGEAETSGTDETEAESYETDHENFSGQSRGSAGRGRWVRRGRRIILYGL